MTERAASNTNAGLIELSGITKVFQAHEVRTFALSEIDLTVARGEYMAITGPSGCGKSTLLAIMGLLECPTNGEYRLDGRRLDSMSARQRAEARNRQIGFVFQSFNLLPHLTVAANVELPLLYRGMSRSERSRLVQRALERVGMLERAAHHPVQLSGGQQQRVAVARAVVGEPVILLADEPTGNLDSKNGERVMELLSELHKSGTTLCMVTHEPSYAAQADRIVSLLDGQFVPGDVPPLMSHPHTADAASLPST